MRLQRRKTTMSETLNQNIDNIMDKYARSAEFIKPLLSPKLQNAFNELIVGTKAEDCVRDYILGTPNGIKIDRPLYEPVTIERVISSGTFIALSKEDLSSAISTYREFRRINKRNAMLNIRKEIESPDKMGPRNPQLLRKYAESVINIENTKRTSNTTLSVEEIMRETFNELEEWRGDTSAPASDFLFIKSLLPKSIAKCFIDDVILESLFIILKDFNGSIEGFNTKLPTEFKNPLFSYRNTSMEFEADIITNELTFFKNYSFEGDEDDTVGDITIRYDAGKKLPTTNNPKAIPSLLSTYQVDLKRKDLDLKDQELLTYLFNKITGENTVNSLIAVNLSDLARSVYGISKLRKKYYQDIGERLEKIKSYDYTISIKNKKTGDVIETTSLSLLTYYSINYEEGILYFTPSEQWIRTYVQKKYINILTDSYKSVDSPRTRSIMTLLQYERIAEFSKGSSHTTLNLKYFRNHMKLDKMPNATLVKELTHHLSILEREQIVVQSFEFVNRNSFVSIEFCPMDTREILAYEFNTKALEQKETIIDADIDVKAEDLIPVS